MVGRFFFLCISKTRKTCQPWAIKSIRTKRTKTFFKKSIIFFNIRIYIIFPNKYQGHVDLNIPFYKVSEFYKVSDMNSVGNEIVMKNANNYVSDELLCEMKKKAFSVDAIIFAKVGAAIFLDRKRIAKAPFLVDNNMMIYALNNNAIVFKFLYYWFTNQKLAQYAQTGALPSYNATDIEHISMVFPTDKDEQKLIADFLSNVDEVIAASEEEVTNLEQQKKAVMQKIFSQEVRFKKDDGSDFPDWERMSMSDIFKEIIDKNHPEMPVLSILQGVGTVLRDESDRNILYDKSNLKGYKAMKKDDFIIHLRTFEGGLECSNHDGISSPAYKILRTDKLVPTVYRAYFRSHDFIERKLSVAVTGIRDGKNIDMPTFWEIQMDIPSFPEQQKIADFLTSYDEAITAAKQELAKWKELKKGLLQQMFV